jgi:hypothetical protein
VTKSDFIDWKRHSVTQEVFSQLEGRINQLTEELISQTAYMSQSEMAEKAGAIKAFRDMIQIEFEGEDS